MCDGKWDCPSGKDETEHASCETDERCIDMFKCKSSQICIHLGNVCDGLKDCFLGDDESLCELHKCPSMCKCLALALECKYTTLLVYLYQQHFLT